MKKKFIFLLCAFFIFLSPVLADEPTSTEDFIQEDVLNETIIVAGEKSNYEKKNEGSALLVGNVVDYKGSTDGLLIAAGNSVTSKGQGEFGLLAGISVEANSVILKDAVILGNTVVVEGEYGRDLYVIGSNVKISGKVGRNLYIYASTVELDNLEVVGNVDSKSDTMTISKTVTVNGKMSYKSMESEVEPGATIPTVHYEKITLRTNSINRVKTSSIACASLLIVFVTIALLNPKLFENVGKEKPSFMNLVTYAGYALVFLILVPVAALILLTLAIGTPLAIITLAAYMFIIYISYAVTGYYVGKIIMNKFKKDDNILLAGLIGIVLLSILSFIPVAGPIITFISYLVGIGMFLFNFKK